MDSKAAIVKQTYFWDKVRGAAQGILETGHMGLALVIAIEVFDAPYLQKSLIAAAHPIGLLFTPLTLGLIAVLNKQASKVASILLFASAASIAVAAFADSLTSYFVPLLLAAFLGTQSIPMMAHIYAANYPSNRRGRYLSTSFMFSVATTLVFSLFFGYLLDLNHNYYSTVLASLSIATLVCAFAIGRIPSTIIHQESAQNPLRNLSYAFTDHKFGVMLLSWMFLGLGNLMLMPLRFEYLIKDKYGIVASTLMVAWLTLGLPSLFRFLSAKFWGRLFDSMDFMPLRMILNTMQMISITLFFTTTNMWVLNFSAILMGTAMGGGNLSWNLWVTKFATEERTAAYMSVHTFTTGIRGVAAPFLGFFLLANYGAIFTGVLGASMILISIIMVFILYRYTGPRRRKLIGV